MYLSDSSENECIVILRENDAKRENLQHLLTHSPQKDSVYI